jgi:hypothetical protein
MLFKTGGRSSSRNGRWLGKVLWRHPTCRIRLGSPMTKRRPRHPEFPGANFSYCCICEVGKGRRLTVPNLKKDSPARSDLFVRTEGPVEPGREGPAPKLRRPLETFVSWRGKSLFCNSNLDNLSTAPPFVRWEIRRFPPKPFGRAFQGRVSRRRVSHGRIPPGVHLAGMPSPGNTLSSACGS